MKVDFSIESISPAQLSGLCGGDLRGGFEAPTSLSSICTDSREATPESVFVALRGERVDGHDYIPAALARGCRCILCEHSCDEILACGACAIVVKDSELSLARLANSYRAFLSSTAVAVTGSVGKTTTKEMVASVLSERFSTFRTPGNHNSLVGMPLSMISIPTDTEYAVLEMGMSGFGEIERLSVAAEPDIAIITNVGTSHMEILGSRENICRAKLEILCGLRENGLLLLNRDEPLLAGIHGKSYRTQYVSIEREDCDFFAQNIRVLTEETRFDCVTPKRHYRDLSIRVMGRHNVYAALYAVAVGESAGMREEEIRRGLWSFLPSGMRQHIFQHRGVTFIEDCYNASPESMTAAVNVLAEYATQTGKRSIAVLGDMLELGTDSPMLHRTVGASVAKHRIDRLYTVGRRAEQIAIGARQVRMPTEKILRYPGEDGIALASAALLSELQEGDVVLVKASRAIGLERILEYLKENL